MHIDPVDDVLAIIFSFTPLESRVFVLPFVCKRWKHVLDTKTVAWHYSSFEYEKESLPFACLKRERASDGRGVMSKRKRALETKYQWVIFVLRKITKLCSLGLDRFPQMYGDVVRIFGGNNSILEDVQTLNMQRWFLVDRSDLAFLLRRTPKLKTLRVNWCHSLDAGTLRILKGHRFLEHLELRYCPKLWSDVRSAENAVATLASLTLKRLHVVAAQIGKECDVLFSAFMDHHRREKRPTPLASVLQELTISTPQSLLRSPAEEVRLKRRFKTLFPKLRRMDAEKYTFCFEPQ